MNNGDLFQICKKGYDLGEVEAYVEEINSRNKYLQEQNFMLTAKLSDAQDMVSQYSETEKSLRISIAQSKRAAAEMLSESRARSAALLSSTKEECSAIIAELDAQIEERYQTMEKIRTSVINFKAELFDLYSTHIEMIDSISSTAENFDYAPDFTGISAAIDTFEEKGEPAEPEVPEFPDYPEESIFHDIPSAKNESFIMSDNRPSVAFSKENTAAAAPIDAFDENTQPEFARDVTPDLSAFDEKSSEAEAEPEPAPEKEEDAQLPEIDDDEMFITEDKKDNEEYFKFLENFVNGDEH